MLTPIQQHFRNSMAKLAAGVNIITTNGIAGEMWYYGDGCLFRYRYTANDYGMY